MPGKEIKGTSKIANYRHGGRAGFSRGGGSAPWLRGRSGPSNIKAPRGSEGFKQTQQYEKKIGRLTVGKKSDIYKPPVKKTPAERRPAWEKAAEKAETIKLNKQLKTAKKVAAGAGATVAGSLVYGKVKQHKKTKKAHEEYMKSRDK